MSIIIPVIEFSNVLVECGQLLFIAVYICKTVYLTDLLLKKKNRENFEQINLVEFCLFMIFVYRLLALFEFRFGKRCGFAGFFNALCSIFLIYLS